MIIYKQCPRHYLVIERQLHGTISCYNSLNGASPLPDPGYLTDCYVSAIVLVSCSPARELPSIPLQDAFAKQWGSLNQERNSRRNRLEPAPTEAEEEINLEESQAEESELTMAQQAAANPIGDPKVAGLIPEHHADVTHLSVPVPSDDEDEFDSKAAANATTTDGHEILGNPHIRPVAALPAGSDAAAEVKNDDAVPVSPLSVGSSTQSERHSDFSAVSQLILKKAGMLCWCHLRLELALKLKEEGAEARPNALLLILMPRYPRYQGPEEARYMKNEAHADDIKQEPLLTQDLMQVRKPDRSVKEGKTEQGTIIPPIQPLNQSRFNHLRRSQTYRSPPIMLTVPDTRTGPRRTLRSNPICSHFVV